MIGLLILAGLLGGCASSGTPRQAGDSVGSDEGADIADAVPRVEPKSKYGNPASYVVRGKRYRTKGSSAGHVERGLASWYGKQFHGRKTSSGERYNMYAMTAAHKTLPLPTYVRVTNLENGRSAVVKVNDRGPFHGPRVIDLSYSAAKKLGVVQKGTAMVEVRAIDPNRPGSDTGPFFASKAAKAKPRTVAINESKPAPRPSMHREAPPAREDDATRERAMDAALAATGAERVATSESRASGQGLYLQVGAFGDPSNAERLRKRLGSQLAEQVRVQSSIADGPTLYKVRVGPLSSEGEARQVSAKLATLGVSEPRPVWN
jgi:rare lipoprotein A